MLHHHRRLHTCQPDCEPAQLLLIRMAGPNRTKTCHSGREFGEFEEKYILWQLTRPEDSAFLNYSGHYFKHIVYKIIMMKTLCILSKGYKESCAWKNIYIIKFLYLLKRKNRNTWINYSTQEIRATKDN